jgi:hypothetical protein
MRTLACRVLRSIQPFVLVCPSDVTADNCAQDESRRMVKIGRPQESYLRKPTRKARTLPVSPWNVYSHPRRIATVSEVTSGLENMIAYVLSPPGRMTKPIPLSNASGKPLASTIVTRVARSPIALINLILLREQMTHNVSANNAILL